MRTSSVEAVQVAAQSNVEVVVTDHHLPGAVLASARAVVNPKLAGEDTPFCHPSGVGVAFKLAHALSLRGRGLTAKEILSHLDLVVVGTVADVVRWCKKTVSWYGTVYDG